MKIKMGKKKIALLILLAITVCLSISPLEAFVSNNDGQIVINKSNFLNYFNVNGDASYDEEKGLITLTPDEAWKSGNITLKTKVDMAKPFSFTVYVYTGAKTQLEGGADGMSFFLHGEDVNTVGAAGNSMGMGHLPFAAGFKIDTNWNSEVEGNPLYGPDPIQYTYGDAFGAFVVTDECGRVYTVENEKEEINHKLVSSPSVGVFKEFKMFYNGKGIMSVDYDDKYWEIDLRNNLTGIDKDIYSFAIAASTGSYYNVHQIQLGSFKFYPEYTEGTVIAHYVDENHNPLLSDFVHKGTVGEAYETKPKKIKNYDLKETVGKTSGMYQKDVIEVTYIYTSTIKSNEKYRVTHEFISGTNGRELPEEILKLLPEPIISLENGTKVQPNILDKTKLKMKNGTWTFKGWNYSELLLNGKDEKFIGSWIFIEESKDRKDNVKKDERQMVLTMKPSSRNRNGNGSKNGNRYSSHVIRTNDNTYILGYCLSLISTVIVFGVCKRKRRDIY